MTNRRQKSEDRSQKKKQIEARLVEIGSQPGFRRQMQRSAADIKAGRVLTQVQLKQRVGKRGA